MKVSASALLFAAALGGVSAHPSGHAHKHAHRSLEERANFVKAGKPAPPEPTTTSTTVEPTTTSAPPPPPPKPTTTTTAEPEPTSPSNGGGNGGGSGGEGQGVSTYTEFCGGNKKRATLGQITYKGNVGTDGNYGCNWMLAKSNVAEEYKYSMKISNAKDAEQDCACYNKIGPNGGVDGFWDGNEAIRFKLPAKGTQYVVADENTQGGCVCDVGKLDTTSWGQFASTWAEVDFGNESNNGWSGGDASCLVSAAQNRDIPGLLMCGHGSCSKIFPGGDGVNAFLAGMEALDGLGLNIPAGPAHIEVTVGYSG